MVVKKHNSQEVNLLEEQIQSILQSTEYELYQVEIATGARGYKNLNIYIDKPGGITIDELSKLGREIRINLSANPKTEHYAEYNLEVSSPGINRALFKPEHFKANTGKKVSLHLKTALNTQPEETRRKYSGIILKADDSTIELEVDNEVIKIEYPNIEKARLNIDPLAKS